MSATNMPAPHRGSRPVDHEFEAGGQSDFALLGALVPNDPDGRAIPRKEAAKRGLSVEGILRRIADTMLGDRLFGAVLEDANDIGRCANDPPVSLIVRLALSSVCILVSKVGCALAGWVSPEPDPEYTNRMSGKSHRKPRP